jgi:hypothetical protein
LPRFAWVIEPNYPQGHLVQFTPAQEAQADADDAAAQATQAATANAQANSTLIQGELQSTIANALSLADLLDANTATPAQQRQALSLCLHGLVRLAKVVYRTYEVPA